MNLSGIYPIFSDRWNKYQDIYLYSDPHFGDGDSTKTLK